MKQLRGFHKNEVPVLRPGRGRRGETGAAETAALPKELLDVLWREPELRLRFLARLEQEEAERDRRVQS